MCHTISWYHALCLHSDQASTVHICCETALHCSYDCDLEESWSLPILGACRLCTVKAAFAENLSLRSEACAVAVSPVVEGAEKVSLVGGDEPCSFETQIENAVDELELFDEITF